MAKRSRTIAFALIGAAAGAVVVADFGPMVTKIAGCLVTFTTSASFIVSQDAVKVPKVPGPTVPPDMRSLLLLLLLAPLLCLTGCNEKRDAAIVRSMQAIDQAAASLPPGPKVTPQVNGIRANARATAHALGQDLPPIVPEPTP